MASAIDAAIAKVDALLLAAGSVAPAAEAPRAASAPGVAPSKPAAQAAPKAAPAPPAAVPAPAATAASSQSAADDAAAREAFQLKVQIKVARITSAEPLPSSEKLLKLKADLGPGDSRQIMAGLQQYLAPADLEGRLLCVVSNLKPAKLAGEPSEAMVLAAESAGEGGKAIVRPLIPPEGSQPGDPVHLDGATPVANPKVLKLDEWRKVSPGLVVAGGRATFNGIPLMTPRGYVCLAPEIADGAQIH